MMTPIRIQRKRIKGYRMPEGAVSLTRPGRFGNWFTVGMWFRNVSGDWYVSTSGNSSYFGNQQVRDLEHSLELFEDYARHRIKWQPDWLTPLLDKPFWACWCKLESRCHVDILLKLI